MGMESLGACDEVGEGRWMTVAIEPLDAFNLEDVVRLLEERNGTAPAHTRWKYAPTGDGIPRGFVARIDSRPVGCFGRLPRELCLASGQVLRCGWFADWYVNPSARGRQVGQQLLAALAWQDEPVFGHPAPDQAQALCRRQGYRELGFHTRLRIVLRPWRYQRARTHFGVKALARMAAQLVCSHSSRLRARLESHAAAPSVKAGYFADTGAFGEWIKRQPTASGVTREWGQWERDGLRLVYFDDVWAGIDPIRMIAYAKGKRLDDSAAWSTFFRAAARSGSSHVELFTCWPTVDRVWRSAGAQRVREAPILVRGLPAELGPVEVQGWDRENFAWRAVAPAPGTLQ